LFSEERDDKNAPHITAHPVLGALFGASFAF
jgi:hypothetical protein